MSGRQKNAEVFLKPPPSADSLAIYLHISIFLTLLLCDFNYFSKIQFFQPNFFVYKYFSVIPKDSEASHRVLYESFEITEKYL